GPDVRRRAHRAVHALKHFSLLERPGSVDNRDPTAFGSGLILEELGGSCAAPSVSPRCRLLSRLHRSPFAPMPRHHPRPPTFSSSSAICCFPKANTSTRSTPIGMR